MDMLAPMWKAVIPGKPFGKQRARVLRRGGSYTPEQTVLAENWVRQNVIEQIGNLCLEGPLSVRMLAVFAVPASWSKKKRAEALSGHLRPTGKPDMDNVAKLCLDALNGILWLDDSQIVEFTFSKVYGPKPEVQFTLQRPEDPFA